MPIEFRCTECHKLLRTPDGTEGLEAQCPRCRAIAVVPGGSAAPPTHESGPAADWTSASAMPPPLPPQTGDEFPGVDVSGRNPFAGYAPPAAAPDPDSPDFNPYGSPVAIDTGAHFQSGERPDLATRFERFGGALVDGVLTLAGMVPGFGVIASGALDDLPPDDLELASTAVLYGGALLIGIVQWVLITARGQSLGKMAVGTRIVMRRGGELPGFYRGVVLRAWLPALIGGLCCSLFFLIDVLAIFGRERRCLHDEFANTIVVRVR